MLHDGGLFRGLLPVAFKHVMLAGPFVATLPGRCDPFLSVVEDMVLDAANAQTDRMQKPINHPKRLFIGHICNDSQKRHGPK
jgi:hypothetical protein